MIPAQEPLNPVGPWKTDRDAVLTVSMPFNNLPESDMRQFCVLEVSNGRGLAVMRVFADGRMEFNPDFEPSEQARAFQTALMMASQRAIWPTAIVKEKSP